MGQINHVGAKQVSKYGANQSRWAKQISMHWLLHQGRHQTDKRLVLTTKIKTDVRHRLKPVWCTLAWLCVTSQQTMLYESTDHAMQITDHCASH
jgi:hypothetical protein